MERCLTELSAQRCTSRGLNVAASQVCGPSSVTLRHSGRASIGFAAVAVVGLGVAGLVHVYWAFGGVWPGSNRADLARKVVGSTDVFPSTAMTFGVTALLFAAAVLVAGAVELVSLPINESLIVVGAWGVAGVLLIRGVAGFYFSGRAQVRGRGTPFTIRDVRMYSPFTLVMSGLIVTGLLSVS